MTDMFTGMPFYWTGPNPVNVVPPNQAIANNLAQNAAANQANSAAVSNASANVGANANIFDPFAQSGGFGKMTDYYSGLGAAYGRATGGFGGKAGRVGTISNPGTSNPGYLDGGKGLFNAPNYQQQNPDVWSSGADPFQHYFEHGQKEGRSIQTFNPYQYQQQNPDVWKSGADPFQHYNQYGKDEGRGGAWSDFDARWYGEQNPDVKASGVDPTAHWFEYGQKEGRQGSALSPLSSYQGTGFDAFDPNIYGGSHPTAGFGEQPTAGALQQNWNDLWNERGPFNRSQSSDADAGRNALAADYYAGNKDVFDAAKASGQDPTTFALNHLLAHGDDEDRRFFDRDAYLNKYKDVRDAGMDPTAHWFQYGSKEGREAPMSGAFDANWYSQLNPDVAAAGVDPTAHWLQYGMKEGRQGGAAFNAMNQMGEAAPAWQSVIPKAYQNPEAYEAMKNTAFGQIDPSSLAGLFMEESRWDPRARTGEQYGIAQMAKDDFNYRGAGGTLGGLTFDQYKNASAAEQIGAYADLLARMQAANPGLNFAAMTPQRQYAVLQALNFGPYTGEPGTIQWIKAMNEGNTSIPTTNKPQAKDLKTTSIDDIERAYLAKQSRMPTSGR